MPKRRKAQQRPKQPTCDSIDVVSTGNDAVPYQLERQNAFTESMSLASTVQPVDTDRWIELDQVLDMVDDGLAGIDAAVRQVGADLAGGLDVAGIERDLAELQQAAKSMSADTMQYLEELGMAATSLVSQSVANCVNPAIEMEALGDDMLDLAAVPSPFASRSSSAASLGLVGLFTQPGECSSPVSTLDVPAPASPRMVK